MRRLGRACGLICDMWANTSLSRRGSRRQPMIAAAAVDREMPALQ